MSSSPTHDDNPIILPDADEPVIDDYPSYDANPDEEADKPAEGSLEHFEQHVTDNIEQYKATPSDLPSGDVEQILERLLPPEVHGQIGPNGIRVDSDVNKPRRAEAVTALQALQDKKVAEVVRKAYIDQDEIYFRLPNGFIEQYAYLAQLTNKSKGGK